MPLRDLRLDVGDHEAPDGTLRIVENLRPAGPQRNPYYTPTPPSIAYYDTSALDGTPVALGLQIRNSRGEWSTQSDSSLKRHIIVTSEKIYLLDEANSFRLTEVYDFGGADLTRKAQFAPVAETVIIAISNGADQGAPELLLQLRDDTCFDYNLPALPEINATPFLAADADSLAKGYYAYRYAYEMSDGSIGPVSEARIVNASANTLNQVLFTILRVPSSLTDNWKKLIRSVIVYMTQKSEEDVSTEDSHLIGLMNSPFFEVSSFTDIVAGTQVTFSDTNESVVSGRTLDDTNLAQHFVYAAAAFAYNRQVLLGDVAFDYREPLWYGLFETGAGEGVPYFKIYINNPYLEEGSGDDIYYEILMDVPHIQTITIGGSIVGGVDFQFERWNGTSWDTTGCPAVNTNYDDAVHGPNTYTRMRVVITEIGNVSAPSERTLTIDATSANGFSATQLQQTIEFRVP